MSKYVLSNTAKEDLIRVHQFGTKKFGPQQADKYFNDFFEVFNSIANRPFSFESVDYIRSGYRKCVCGSDTIYFRLDQNIVQIMTIIGKQDVEKAKNSW
ncbi:MAG: type II toxin-antitoxin system RelE/ParE family toxin [Crocinitomicaceae bacterium]